MGGPVSGGWCLDWVGVYCYWDVPEAVPWVPEAFKDDLSVFDGMEVAFSEDNIAVIVKQLTQGDQVGALERWYYHGLSSCW